MKLKPKKISFRYFLFFSRREPRIYTCKYIYVYLIDMNLEENTEQSLITLIFSSLTIELASFTILAKKYNSNLVSLFYQYFNAI